MASGYIIKGNVVFGEFLTKSFTPPDTFATKLKNQMHTSARSPLPIAAPQSKPGTFCPSCGSSHKLGTVCGNKGIDESLFDLEKAIFDHLETLIRSGSKPGGPANNPNRAPDGKFGSSGTGDQTGRGGSSSPVGGSQSAPASAKTGFAKMRENKAAGPKVSNTAKESGTPTGLSTNPPVEQKPSGTSEGINKLQQANKQSVPAVDDFILARPGQPTSRPEAVTQQTPAPVQAQPKYPGLPMAQTSSMMQQASDVFGAHRQNLINQGMHPEQASQEARKVAMAHVLSGGKSSNPTMVGSPDSMPMPPGDQTVARLQQSPTQKPGIDWDKDFPIANEHEDSIRQNNIAQRAKQAAEEKHRRGEDIKATGVGKRAVGTPRQEPAAPTAQIPPEENGAFAPTMRVDQTLSPQVTSANQISSEYGVPVHQPLSPGAKASENVLDQLDAKDKAPTPNPYARHGVDLDQEGLGVGTKPPVTAGKKSPEQKKQSAQNTATPTPAQQVTPGVSAQTVVPTTRSNATEVDWNRPVTFEGDPAPVEAVSSNSSNFAQGTQVSNKTSPRGPVGSNKTGRKPIPLSQAYGAGSSIGNNLWETGESEAPIASAGMQKLHGVLNPALNQAKSPAMTYGTRKSLTGRLDQWMEKNGK